MVSYGRKEQFLLYLITFLVTGQFLYFLYNIDENGNGHPNLVEVVKLICHTIEKCVMGYFETFQYCWYWALYWMWRMISDYLVLLGIVVSCLSASPTCYVFVAGACLMLFLTYTFILDLKNGDEF